MLSHNCMPFHPIPIKSPTKDIIHHNLELRETPIFFRGVSGMESIE